MRVTTSKVMRQVQSAVHDALDLLDNAALDGTQGRDRIEPDPLPSLLEQCGHLAETDKTSDVEPIRTIHHFACTGGTLITKCLACSPNVHALSEVDPLSTVPATVGKFAPSDLIQLTGFSNRASTMEEKLDLFLGSLKVLHQSNQKKGLRVLVRDHAHGHFCIGSAIPERLTVREILHRTFPVLSIVTVRHPIDSWLALKVNHWHQFNPATADEYARRYEVFLDKYQDVMMFRYEDFLEDPAEELASMCRALNLAYPEDFQELFSVHSFSGDSGRSGGKIEPRVRRSIPGHVHQELRQSRALCHLCERLGYEWNLDH